MPRVQSSRPARMKRWYVAASASPGGALAATRRSAPSKCRCATCPASNDSSSAPRAASRHRAVMSAPV